MFRRSVMRVPVFLALIISISFPESGVFAQTLRPVNDARGIYCRAALDCSTQVEYSRSPSAPFTAFHDSVQTQNLQGCIPFSFAVAGASQTSVVLSDSIYIHEVAGSLLSGASALASVARS